MLEFLKKLFGRNKNKTVLSSPLEELKEIAKQEDEISCENGLEPSQRLLRVFLMIKEKTYEESVCWRCGRLWEIFIA